MQQKTLNRLPQVPLSPLIQISRDYAKSLAMTTKSLSEENNNLATLKKDFTEQSERLEELKKRMQSIQCALLTDLNIYDIAKEIAYVNCSLFRMVKLDERILCDFDRQSNIIPLLDFHHYLSHALAHIVIYASPNPAVVAQLIQLAYILLHIYRDFSGCTAVLTCLQMPSVQRLSPLWQQCPSKLLDVYQALVTMVSPQNGYEAYHHQLWLHTSQFLDISPTKSQMIAVPFMQAHLNKIRQLVDQERLSSPFINHNTVEVILSESSQQSLYSITHILRFCQQHAHLDAAELERYAVLSFPPRRRQSRRISFQSNHSHHRRSNQTIRLSIPPSHELDLLKSNQTIYHWLVSRAYLTRTQLHNESVCVKPLEQGESEVAEENDEDDIYWEFFREEKVVCVNIGHLTSTTATTTPSTTRVDDLEEDTQAVVDQLTIHPPPPLPPPESTSNAAHVTIPTTSPENDKTEAEAKPDIPSIQNQIPTSKPILSPSAPEFIPQHLNEPVRRYISDDDQDDDDVIILTEEDDEEWTGYPLENTSSHITSSEEEWTGYPMTSSQDEDEDEIWRGYPMPQDEEEEQHISSPTSPFTPREEITEEWKGYKKTLEDTHQSSLRLANDTSLFHSTQ